MGDIFQRVEKKYVLTSGQLDKFLELVRDNIMLDQYGEVLICNLYFDNEKNQIVRDSIEKPLYKEKLRLRSYGIAKNDSKVFLELKKKYKGIVYKRRVEMTNFEAMEYINNKIKPFESQIIKEVDWMINFYQTLKPAMYVSYYRKAYFGKDNSELRITFDRNLRYRTNNLTLDKSNKGVAIVDKHTHIMEIKVLDAMPIWLIKGLEEAKIFPVSFSKYGEAYKNDNLKCLIA